MINLVVSAHSELLVTALQQESGQNRLSLAGNDGELLLTERLWLYSSWLRSLLDSQGLSVQDISLWEINEAFAVVVIANCRLLGIERDKVNIHGGAISIGHPFGMSGARITNHLVLNLQPGQYGVATLCNGGGGAGSMLVQRL